MQENYKLKDARLLARKTGRQVAEAVGIHVNTYRGYERAEKISFPSADIALKIAGFLGATVEELFLPDNVRETHELDNGRDKEDEQCNG